ncbi:MULTISPECIES: 3-oxoacyl-[acyl-carrier-protein] reductase [Mesotoga]|uniref:3-oxoacyl-[acyl-carrier-protein] reductase n=1 Tax=Mesotoga TaxID=1184396 RepID=UPI00039EFA3E|nr:MULTISPECIES: 3-oxoacyl-[acyl-carrier-protein] reductase [Mesotoga]MCP5457788.1 3-oxoacyl-[acyl-carrier-protein] reductase [Thermotogota bacterium]MCP5460113.1 3-oxoacyl-[acyl-carrier-protein] reductase [Thermotogota bacterium]HNQ70636.1 3-oxoacyl-[acyl-carrier-protein] reductase [Mesotoga prima]HNS75564.1 3-oxoacyl-[acyl-carrier-protein] reductase [Mesotoga prima]HOP37999.1 3-oxoacyl-[acyl-carrier-protein] reductase [Mesotoga prima]
MRLEGKVVIITGGASGLGKAAVEKFAREGAIVYACDMDVEGLDNLKKEFSELPGKVIPKRLNVTDRPAITELVGEIKSEFGRIDGLINNAGVTRDALIQRMSEEDWDLVINVNLKGVFNMTQAVAPVMIDQGYGSIVNTSSIVGVYGNIGQSNYSASKGGVIAMTKTWAKELTRKGAKIRVNAVAPGFIKTPMTEKMPEKILVALEEKIPLKRMGLPEEIANVYFFLISDESSYLTGQVIGVDGGLVI